MRSPETGTTLARQAAEAGVAPLPALDLVSALRN
jgi:hypothetical protein